MPNLAGFAAGVSGLAFGLARAVRPARAAVSAADRIPGSVGLTCKRPRPAVSPYGGGWWASPFRGVPASPERGQDGAERQAYHAPYL